MLRSFCKTRSSERKEQKWAMSFNQNRYFLGPYELKLILRCNVYRAHTILVSKYVQYFLTWNVRTKTYNVQHTHLSCFRLICLIVKQDTIDKCLSKQNWIYYTFCSKLISNLATEIIGTCIFNRKLAEEFATCTYILRGHDRNSMCGWDRT